MKFVMQRNRQVVSKLGRVIEFQKGEPAHVPPELYDEVLAAGGVPEEELPEAQGGTSTAPTDPAERQLLLLAAIEDLVQRNQRGDFTASGAPNAKVLAEAVDFNVDSRERDQAWAKFQQQQRGE